jgi:hypothetical protein
MRLVFPTVLIAVIASSGCADSTDSRPATFEYIATTILRPGCAGANCHNSMTKVQGLDFSTVAAANTAFEDRPLAPQTGDPNDSELVFLMTTTGDKRMPLDGPMPDVDIELIRSWIIDGAVR